MAALAALLHRGHGPGHLLSGVDASAGNSHQIGHRSAVLVDGTLEILRVFPDLRAGRVALLRIARRGEVLPRELDGISQPLGVGGKGLTVKGHTPGEHATHGLAVVQELLERSLTLAFRRARVGRTTAATSQGKTQGGEQQNSGIRN